MARGLPPAKVLLLILGVFAWFATSVESNESKYIRRIAADPRVLLTNPLLALGAMVDRNGDDRLFYNYAQLMLGHPADLDYLSHKEQGDPATALARVKSAITPDGRARLPYRDFPVEYPPVPLLLMLLPRLLVDSYGAYRVVFTALTAALFLLAAWLAARICTMTAAVPGTPSVETVWRRLGWLLFAIGPILCQRFDILPAAMVAVALAALADRRDRLAGVALGLAVMTKLYPLLLCLPLATFFLGAGHRRRVLVIAGFCALTVVLVVAPFLIVTPGPFLRSNTLYGARPFHFESTWGSVLLAIGGPSVTVSSFGSRNVISPAWLLQLSSLFLFGGLAAVARAAWKSGRALARSAMPTQFSALLVWAFAALLLILCTSKVLSPQFLIWLVPLAAVVPAPAGKHVFLTAFAACALTQVFYPALYDLAAEGNTIALALLLARNALLVAMTVVVLRLAGTRAKAAISPAI
jgi:hypothetical protein